MVLLLLSLALVLRVKNTTQLGNALALFFPHTGEKTPVWGGEGECEGGEGKNSEFFGVVTGFVTFHT